MIIEVKNADVVSDFINKVNEEIEKKIPESVKQAAFFLQAQVKDSIAHGTNAPVSVDTGRFLNSIDVQGLGKNEAKVFTDIEYGKFLEYGTKYMNPRPHFRNTVFINQEQIKQQLNNDIKFILNKAI